MFLLFPLLQSYNTGNNYQTGDLIILRIFDKFACLSSLSNILLTNVYSFFWTKTINVDCVFTHCGLVVVDTNLRLENCLVLFIFTYCVSYANINLISKPEYTHTTQ